MTMVELENESGEWKAFSVEDVLASVLSDIKSTIENTS